MTTEGQGRTSEPVGFGIPVMISGPWSQPQIYPDMAGMMDNPDAAYAKLREMGKGLFGPDGAKLGDILGSFGLGTTTQGNNAAGNTNPQIQLPNNMPMPGGQLGEAIGNLIQQGLSNSPLTSSPPSSNPGGSIRSRSLTGTSATPAAQASPAPPNQAPSQDQSPQAPSPQPPPVAQQDSQPMNDVMRQLFNR
jgi:AsmA protein